jgi:hypothetical protein
MSEILWLAGALVVLAVLRPFLRVIIATLFGKAVGEAALARTPDRLQMRRTDARAWKDTAAATAPARPLLARGFEDAGVYASDSTPGLVLRLFAREEDSLRAAIYEHPKVGIWTETFVRFADGGSATFTTMPDPGLAPRPGHTVIRMPGASVESLVERAAADKRATPKRPARVESIAREFEADYADGMAWRKARGVTTREVVAVAKRPPGQPVR